MRDHTKLRAFELADDLAVRIYIITRKFPKEEIYRINITNEKSCCFSTFKYRRRMCQGKSDGIPSISGDCIWIIKGIDYQYSLAIRLNYIQ